jgi:lysophospholipase L1-like esterase
LPLAAGTSRYVALGDSFSAGSGVAPYRDGARCQRSTLAYPDLLGRDLDGATVEVRACPDARLADLADQLAAAPLGDDVGLVTLTIGGNDANFGSVLWHCATSRHCLDEPYTSDDGTHWESLAAWADAFLAGFPTDLTAMLAELQAAAPHARVLVVGYPHLFPTDRDSSWRCRALFNDLTPLGFGHDEVVGVGALGDRLNAALHAAATAAGVEFVDPIPAWGGHEACGAAGEWLSSHVVDLDVPPSVHDGAFHPTAEGQRQYASLIAQHLRTG